LLIHQLILLVNNNLLDLFNFEYLVDATDCGSGNLEIAISRDGENIPNYVENEGGARFRIKFIPNQSGIHYIQIKFNGIDIPGKNKKFNLKL